MRYADLHNSNLRNADLRYADLLTFLYNRDTAYYQFDGMIRIGCKYFKTAYWVENFEKIGKENNYSELEILVYGQFIIMCDMLENEREK